MKCQAAPNEDEPLARAAEDLAHREEAHFRQADGLDEIRLEIEQIRLDQIGLRLITSDRQMDLE